MKKSEMSIEHLKFVRKQKNTSIIIHAVRIALLITFFAVWEILAKYEIIDSFLMSSPSRIIKTLKDLIISKELFKHLYTTLYETFLGFLIATGVGSIIALILWWSENVRRVLEPYIVVLNSLPKIALGPIIIVWFGAGAKAIIFMAILITVIVTVITMENGFLSAEQNKIVLLKSMGASKMQILLKLVIPSSLPTFISCLKINVGMAWIGSIMGEYLVSKEGLGYLIVYGGQVFKLDLVMASTVILCVLAGLMYFIVAIAEKLVSKHR